MAAAKKSMLAPFFGPCQPHRYLGPGPRPALWPEKDRARRLSRVVPRTLANVAAHACTAWRPAHSGWQKSAIVPAAWGGSMG